MLRIDGGSHSAAPRSPEPAASAPPVSPDAAERRAAAQRNDRGVQAQADGLVQRETRESCSLSLPGVGGINCRQDTDGAAVGKEIAAIAKTETARARALLDKTLDQVPDAGDRREIARGLIDNLASDDLRRLAAAPSGSAMLQRARTELRNDGSPNDGEQKAIARVDTAIKAAQLSSDPEFGKLDAATRTQVLDQMTRHETDAAAVDNIVALAGSGGFQSAAPAVRTELLAALDSRAGDPIFRAGLERLAAEPNFARLNPAQQADAIRAFDQFASRDVYQGKDGSWFFNIGARSVSDADKRNILDNLAGVVTARGFHDVGADSREALLGAFSAHATDAGFSGRLVNLVNDRGFLGLNDGNLEVDLLKAYAGDEHFAAGLDAVIASGAYTALGRAARASVIGDATRLVKTDSYQDTDAAHRQEMVEMFGDIAAFSAAHSGRTSIRNSIDRVLSGDIKLHVYQEAPEVTPHGTFLSWGYANDDGIFLNTDAATRAAGGAAQFADTLVHEVNHFVNGNTDAGTADRFLDEYRAAVVGQEARLGRALTPAEQRGVVDNLVDGTNNAYAHLHDPYNDDATFQQAVDDLRETLDGNLDPAINRPPASVSPETLRQRLLDAGITSNYLNTAGDLDN